MIKYLGVIKRDLVKELYSISRLGVVLYQPAKNHNEAQPIKMFEYMASGVPILCSNFPLWKTFVEENGCGVCVDCQKTSEVHDAIVSLINDERKLSEMARNGYMAVVNKYNWEKEKEKLIALYDEI